MIIVTVRHVNDNLAKQYLFESPKHLKKGDYVLVLPKDGRKPKVAVCTADSIVVKKEVMEYLAFDSPWSLPLKRVIGKMDQWEKVEVEEDTECEGGYEKENVPW